MHIQKFNSDPGERHGISNLEMHYLHLLDRIGDKTHSWYTEVGDFDVATQSYDFTIDEQILVNRIYDFRNQISAYVDQLPATTIRVASPSRYHLPKRVKACKHSSFQFDSVVKKLVLVRLKMIKTESQLGKLAEGSPEAREAVLDSLANDESRNRITLERTLYAHLSNVRTLDYSSNDYRDDDDRSKLLELAYLLTKYGWKQRDIAEELHVSKDYLRTHLPTWRRDNEKS